MPTVELKGYISPIDYIVKNNYHSKATMIKSQLQNKCKKLIQIKRILYIIFLH